MKPGLHHVFHDTDGTVYPMSVDGDELPWPESWPERIACVRTFCRARNIPYLYGMWGYEANMEGFENLTFA